MKDPQAERFRASIWLSYLKMGDLLAMLGHFFYIIKMWGTIFSEKPMSCPLSQPWLLSQPHPSADRTGGRCFLVLPAFLSHQTTSTSGENSEWFRIWGRVNTCGQTGPSEYGDKHPDPCLLFWRVRGWVPYPWIWIDFRGAVCLRPSCFLLITVRRRGLTIDITPEGNMISLPTQHMVSLWMHLSGTQTCLEHPQESSMVFPLKPLFFFAACQVWFLKGLCILFAFVAWMAKWLLHVTGVGWHLRLNMIFNLLGTPTEAERGLPRLQ